VKKRERKTEGKGKEKTKRKNGTEKTREN